MQLSKDEFLHYLHYIVLVVALSVCLYIAYSKFIYSQPSSKKGYIPYSSDTTQVLDSNQVINPELLPDSAIRVPPGVENIPPPQPPSNEEKSSEEVSPDNSESGFERRSGGSSEENDVKPKTWMELIIDLLETSTPLLLPIISYYFKPASKNET